MTNVINLFEKKVEKHTSEQRLKMFCIREMLDEEAANEILQHMTVDEAFRFLAEKAVEWERITEAGEFNGK